MMEPGISEVDMMHTALMEASMDGHVEVARLLLDSGAQVRSKGSPLIKGIVDCSSWQIKQHTVLVVDSP